MTNEELRDLKSRVVGEVRGHLPCVKRILDSVDGRIADYISDALICGGVYEVLGIRKVLRLVSAYRVNAERVQRVVRAIEGRWDGERWESGGLMFDTPRGAQHVRLMPYQVWCLFGIYGFDTDEVQGEMVPLRRLCTEADLFQTRKSGKTEFGAAIDFVEACVLGDSNAQVLVCANSKSQSKIAYDALKKFAYQIDPDSMNKAGGRFLRVTADEMTFRPGVGRTGSIKVMSAGGKKKDGLYASLVHADEHGSAAYVKDHSDMQDLVEVCVGSMGPRAEKLTLHTTTAGLVNEGPYQLELRGVEESLIKDAELAIDGGVRSADDYRFSMLLRLDPWDFDGERLEDLDDPMKWRRVNRSIGVTVQPTWYRERLHAAMTKGADTRKEVLTKDFNIWQTDRVRGWLDADVIRRLQKGRRVTDLDDGWVCFVGCDFSRGDDLNAMSYLCYNPTSGEFFADMDAWVTDVGLEQSANRLLFERWVEQGYLHVCPGGVIDENEVLARLVQVSDCVRLMMIGYDAYDAKRFINAFGAWVLSENADPSKVIVPVSQTFATYNGPVQEMDYLVRSGLVEFSDNQLWGWEFGNCMLQESSDGMGNVKPVKRGESLKVDNVQCLLSALWLYDRMEGSVG